MKPSMSATFFEMTTSLLRAVSLTLNVSPSTMFDLKKLQS